MREACLHARMPGEGGLLLGAAGDAAPLPELPVRAAAGFMGVGRGWCGVLPFSVLPLPLSVSLASLGLIATSNFEVEVCSCKTGLFQRKRTPLHRGLARLLTR